MEIVMFCVIFWLVFFVVLPFAVTVIGILLKFLVYVFLLAIQFSVVMVVLYILYFALHAIF